MLVSLYFEKWKCKSLKSCLNFCDSIDYTVHRILQARILEWVAFPFSRGSSQPRDQTQVSFTLQADSLLAEPQGRPRKLEWVAYPFSSGSSQPRNQIGVSYIAGGFFTNWAISCKSLHSPACVSNLGDSSFLSVLTSPMDPRRVVNLSVCSAF